VAAFPIIRSPEVFDARKAKRIKELQRIEPGPPAKALAQAGRLMPGFWACACAGSSRTGARRIHWMRVWRGDLEHVELIVGDEVKALWSAAGLIYPYAQKQLFLSSPDEFQQDYLTAPRHDETLT
jgi:hypothetical protein